MSTLSLVQSRSPSPQPRSRSPSPISSRPPPERFRPRTRSNFTGFKKYPGPNQPQSIMKRQPRIHYTQGRGPSRMRPRSLSRPRSYSGNRMPPLRCFICNMIGHIARNCFTKTRPHPQNRQNFPRRFTRKNLGEDNKDKYLKDISHPEFDFKINITHKANITLLVKVEMDADINPLEMLGIGHKLQTPMHTLIKKMMNTMSKTKEILIDI